MPALRPRFGMLPVVDALKTKEFGKGFGLHEGLDLWYLLPHVCHIQEKPRLLNPNQRVRECWNAKERKFSRFTDVLHECSYFDF